MTEIKGNIRETGLPRLLISFNRNRKTGTLIVRTPIFIKKIYFLNGDAIFASSTYEEDRLGETLIKAGKITLEQYDESVRLLKETGKRQGAILVEQGYLTARDLFLGVKKQVQEIICSLFLLEDAEYAFVEGEIPQQEVITLKMSMGNLIYEGVRRIDNWTRIRTELSPLNNVLKLSSDPAVLFQEVELTTAEREMLGLIDGVRNIRQIEETSPRTSFEAMKTLYVLLSLEIVEAKKSENGDYHSLPPDEILQPMEGSNEGFLMEVDGIYARIDYIEPAELLGVDDEDDAATVREKYYRTARKFHPDRSYGSDDPALKDKLDVIFAAVGKAYASLQPSAAVTAEADDSKKPPEEYFRDGVSAFRNNVFEEAARLFRKAVDSAPENAKYWSHLSLSLTKFPERLKEAETALLESAWLDPENPEHYVNLGLIYLRQEMKQMAREQFEKALSIDPENSRALKGIEKTAS